MKNYTIQSFSPGDEKKIIELLQIVPESWPPFDLQCSSLDHWYWRYRDNPSKLTMITVSKDGSKLIGCLHSIPRSIKVGDNILLGCCSQGFVVHPDYRKFGIGNKLEPPLDKLRQDAGIGFSYFESNNPFYLRALKKRQHYFPILITHFVRIKDIDLHLKMMSYNKKWMINIGFRCLKIINQAHNFMNYISKSKKSIHVQSINRFDARIDKFWDKVSSGYKLISERTKEYMNWRYCDSRGGDYSVKCIQDEDNLYGYIILRINKMKKNYPVGYIVDMLTLPERSDITHALISAAVDYFDRRHVNIIHSRLVKGHPYGKILKKYGFINSTEKKLFFFRPYEAAGGELAQIISTSPSKIYINYGEEAFI